MQEMLKQLMVKLCSAFQARIAHPAVAKFGARAGRLDHGLDQQVADENSVREQDHRGDRPADKDQELKTKDHVGRIQCVLDSLAVRLRVDAELVTCKDNTSNDPFSRCKSSQQFGLQMKLTITEYSLTTSAQLDYKIQKERTLHLVLRLRGETERQDARHQ